MDWYQFLHAERKRKQSMMGMLGMRRTTISENGVDVSMQMVAELSTHVVGIESILTDAGIAYD